ncbi:uncharacterized protein LOC143024865 [Oratosquilla oratoria]|uniref:uncharacterized protein LOC143024865 n=1 Tax=Oratosquilla oratoria TaxID=337810 RepID=UPI003F774D0E
MDLKATYSQLLLFPLILLFAGTSHATINYATDNEGLPPCFPQEFLDQVKCCSEVGDVKWTLDRNLDSIGTLQTRLVEVESMARDFMENVTAQSFDLNTKLSDSYNAIISSSLEKYAESQSDTAEEIRRLRKESSTLQSSFQQIKEKIDTAGKNLGNIKVKEEEIPQMVADAITKSHSSLTTEVVMINSNVEDLESKLSDLKKTVSDAGSRMASAEADINRIAKVIKNLCLPPFSWQGDGCYYMPFTKLSWQKARDTCKELHADLVIPRDYKHFVNWLLSLNLEDDVWIGATDSEKEGNWVWINGKPLDIDTKEFFRWNGSDKEEQDCLEICTHSGYRPTDYECEHENYFICQKQIEIV